MHDAVRRECSGATPVAERLVVEDPSPAEVEEAKGMDPLGCDARGCFYPLAAPLGRTRERWGTRSRRGVLPGALDLTAIQRGDRGAATRRLCSCALISATF